MLEKFRRFLGAQPVHIQAAALPFRKTDSGEIEIMLITSRGSGRWVIPKGWSERSETLSQAAAREAEEEAGITGVIAIEELGRYNYKKTMSKGFYWDCQVAVFPMEVTSIAKRWPERKKRQRKWFSLEQAASLVDEPELAEMILMLNNPPYFG